MPRLHEVRNELIQALEARYGSAQGNLGRSVSTPARSGFERLAAVALELVATSKVAKAALDALQAAGMLESGALASANPLEIDDILKQARVAMAIKSIRPLQKLARWFIDRDPALIEQLPTETIREEWRAINGIGLASADALLLSGLHRVSYPVDRSTFRVLVRHGWLDVTADYDEARLLVERLVRPPETINESGGHLDEVAAANLLADLSRWFERLGRDFCKPTQALCEDCPLRPYLPANGPVEVE